MSRANLTQVDPAADFRDVADVNTNLASFETQTSNIDGENVREEGIDESVLDRTTIVTVVEASPRTAASQRAGIGNLDVAAYGAGLTQSGSFTIALGDIAELEAYIEFPNSGVFAIPTGGDNWVEIVLYAKLDIGVPVAIATSRRRLEATPTGRWGSIVINDILTAVGTYDFTEMYWNVQGGAATIVVGKATNRVTVYKGGAP